MSKNFANVVITDIGMTTLKNYCSLLTAYSNKDYFTPPEFLKQKGRVVKKPTHKGDVYSLAMVILYSRLNQRELFSNGRLLQDLSQSELIRFIAEERKRPKLPDGLDPVICELIKKCWSDDPLVRPSYAEILEDMSKVIFN